MLNVNNIKLHNIPLNDVFGKKDFVRKAYIDLRYFFFLNHVQKF